MSEKVYIHKQENSQICAQNMETVTQSNVKEEKPLQAEDEDVDLEPDMTYTKELRAATKEVHKISDVLVNAKFAFGKFGKSCSK